MTELRKFIGGLLLVAFWIALSVYVAQMFGIHLR